MGIKKHSGKVIEVYFIKIIMMPAQELQLVSLQMMICLKQMVQRLLLMVRGAQSQLRINVNSVGGVPTGLESFEVYNPSVSKLKGTSGNTLDPGASITVFLADEFADLFANASAEAFDRVGDGVIDSVVVTMTDDILDASVDLSDFTFGGVNPTDFNTLTTPDDDVFALIFSTYPDGTGVLTTLDYTEDGFAPALTDDAGNAIVDGSVGPDDSAVPIILSQYT